MKNPVINKTFEEINFIFFNNKKLNWFWLDEWKKFKEGFLALNYSVKPKDIVEFRICDLADKEVAYYLPKRNRVIIKIYL